MSSQTPSPNAFSEVFFDTSVLFDYVLAQDDGTARELLENHESDNYTGSTPKREFEEVKDRREQVIKSIYECDNLSEWQVPPGVDLSENDKMWCAEILAELEQIATRKELEDRLDSKERKFNRGKDMLFDNHECLISEVWPNALDAQLLSSLQFIENNNDRHVVCESADWAANVSSDSLISSDNDDLLSQRNRISQEIDRHRGFETLTIITAGEFLSEDSNY